MIYEDLVGRLQAYYVRVSGAGIWGGITGDINSQVDLQAKFGTVVPVTRELTINGVTYDLSVDRSWSIPVTWGSITGTLSAQTDLQSSLDAKVPTARTLTINGTTYDLSANRSWTISTGISIGDTITSGTAGRVLFLVATNILADSAGLKYSDALGLEVQPTGTITGGFNVGLNIKGSAPTSRITSGAGYGFGTFADGAIAYFMRTTNNWASYENMGGLNLSYAGWGFGGISNPSAIVHAGAKTATDTVMIAQGTTSQTGNLFEARNVGGTVVLSVDVNGIVTSNGSFIGRGRFDYINTQNNAYSCFQFINTNGNTVVYQNLLFSGTTTSFPAIKRNGTQIDIRLADDSAYTNIQAATGIFSAITLSAVDLQTTLDTKTAKLITFNRQTASYTLVLADADKAVEVNNASANTLTVPPNSTVAFPTGTQIILTQYGAGQTTITPGAGVTIRSLNGALKTSGQYAIVTLIKVGTNEWYAGGALTA